MLIASWRELCTRGRVAVIVPKENMQRVTKVGKEKSGRQGDEMQMEELRAIKTDGWAGEGREWLGWLAASAALKVSRGLWHATTTGFQSSSRSKRFLKVPCPEGSWQFLHPLVD